MSEIPSAQTIDTEQIGALLLKIERRRNIAGWHPNPDAWLYVIHERHDVVTAEAIRELMKSMGLPIHSERYTAHPLLRPKLFDAVHALCGVEAMDALSRFAINCALIRDTTNPDVDEWMLTGINHLRSVVRQPGVKGFAFSCEAYATSDSGGARAAHAAGRHLETVPGRQEVRTVVMVDVLDQAHMVHRVRGTEPELMTDTDLTGRTFAVLRMLTDITMNRVLEPSSPEFAARYSCRIDDDIEQ